MTTLHAPVHADTDARIREARRELKRAERLVEKAAPGTLLADIARERLDAAAVRYIALTGHAACHGRYLDEAHAHTRHGTHAAG